VGEFLVAYARHEVWERPDLREAEALTPILQELLAERLLVEEARRRGLDRSAALREQLELQRNGLVRRWVLARVEMEAVRPLAGPDAEPQLRRWYQDRQATLYTLSDEAGKAQVLAFESERARIAADYARHLEEDARSGYLRALHRGRKIQVFDDVLKRL
jgi:hypothetical protein